LKLNFRHILLSRYSLLALAVIAFVLSFVFNAYYTRYSSVNHEKKNLTSYIQRQELDFSQFIKDSSLLRKLVQNKESLSDFKSIQNKEYGVFVLAESVFGPQQLLFWSSQNVVPPVSSYNLSDGEYFYPLLANGYYVIIKKHFSLTGMSNQLWAYAMIPVKSRYYIEGQFLNDEFAYNKTAHKRITISNKPTNFPIISAEGRTLFYIDRKPTSAIPYNDTTTVILRLLALCLFFAFAHTMAESVARRKNSQWRGVATLIAILFVFRLVIYLFPSVFEFRQFELFDPEIYGNNFINPSLGDLLINSLLFSWVTVFAWSKLGNQIDILRRFKGTTKWVIGAISLLFLVLSTFMLASTIRSLVADSNMSFDVTDFFSLNKYSVVGFIVLASLSLGYYYFTRLMFRFILPIFEERRPWIFFGIALTGLVFLTFRSTDPSITFYIPVLMWLICYTWLVSQRGLVINRFHINVAGMLFWIFIFSISISAIIIAENTQKEWSRRETDAENLASLDDQSNEILLSVALTYLDNRFLVSNFKRFYDEENGNILRDSILTANYKGYVNKYNTRLYVFDSTFNSLYNDDDLSYESLNNIIYVQSKRSKNVPDLYSYVSAYNKITYITKRIVNDARDKIIGAAFIVSTPKTTTVNALEAKLFKEPNENDPRESPVLSYAIYKDQKLVESSSKYPFATTLTPNQIPKQEVEKRRNEDFDELWYRDSSEKVIVLSRKKDSYIEAITLFSYIFCSFLFLVTFIQTISFLLKIGIDRRELRNFFQMNIRTQVHSTIIFISILSFLIIGAATISFFITRYNRNNTDKLSRSMKVMVKEMKKRIAEHSIFDDVTKIYEEGSNGELKKLVTEVADIHNVDVNVYDLHGNLQVSSQDNIYQKGVLSKQMNPEAFFHLNRLREVERVQQENISNLSYLSIYAPVRSDDGKEYAYLNIPYFLSQFELNQEISNFLVTIINLNAFIFLIAGVIALFITNRITRSFSIIGDKMREVNLGQLNEEIVWNRNDEIGGLVKEYNKMVSKLGESAEALAKSEREGAWREMARQVAHEIKNPLTPMKLSIQYLQKAILNNSPDVKDLTQNVAHTLVEQIDHLSKIAFDFSQFANIGNTQVELFDMHEVIGSLKELYQRGQQVKINWKAVSEKVMLRADKTQMNRLFTNLFQNAVEACDDDKQCIINVNEIQENGSIVVSVRDNGEGIPSSMQSKIFAPNFTTKSSGTGLGLAMCKSIVEQAQGKIWFETKPGEGTTFHIELPLAN